jgi:hypothetical protein
MVANGHTRSHSFQEFPNLDSASDGTLEHGDSGIVLNLGPEENTSKSKQRLLDTRRLCSVDSAPVGQQAPPSPAYIYSDKRNMPLLEEPSPTHSVFTPSPRYSTSGRSSPGIFILPVPSESSLDVQKSAEISVISNKSRRDCGGPISKKAKMDGSVERPTPFTRKHSMPAMYACKENKVLEECIT